MTKPLYPKREELREDIIFMYRTGEHIERIAVRSGCRMETVKGIIKNYEKEHAGGEEVDGGDGVHDHSLSVRAD